MTRSTADEPPRGDVLFSANTVVSEGPSQLEWHSGILVGRDSGPARAAPRWHLQTIARSLSPRRALEEVVGHSMRGGLPVAVQFSGGRDSSLVLAVAAHIARREGLPLPRAVTVRYPGIADADESEWQHLVTRHLGIELEIVTVPEAADDLAGPLAVEMLQRTGVHLPPTAGVVAGRLAPVLQGHRVLTGEGGDNVLGQQRVTWWSAHLQTRRWPQPHARRPMAFEVLPRGVRRMRRRAELEQTLPLAWMRPGPRAHALDLLASDATGEPWDWRDATWSFLDSRLGRAVTELDAVGLALGMEFSHPLLEPSFVAALCQDAGRWGYAGRTEAVRMLAGDLLPAMIVERESKAYFNGAYSGLWTRSFAKNWDGGGVNPDLVDPQVLRATWSGNVIPPQATAPLQLALAAAVEKGWFPAAEPR